MMMKMARPIKLLKMNKVQMMFWYLSQRVQILLLHLQQQKKQMILAVRVVMYSSIPSVLQNCILIF